MYFDERLPDFINIPLKSWTFSDWKSGMEMVLYVQFKLVCTKNGLTNHQISLGCEVLIRKVLSIRDGTFFFITNTLAGWYNGYYSTFNINWLPISCHPSEFINTTAVLI